MQVRWRLRNDSNNSSQRTSALLVGKEVRVGRLTSMFAKSYLYRMETRHPNHPGELSTQASAAETSREGGEINARAEAIRSLKAAGIDFLVGGAYAYATYTGIYRDTKDLDLFPRKRDALGALDVLEKAGWRVERTDEVWLYKAFRGEWFVDFIFSSGNGVAVVDDEWFSHAKRAVVMGEDVLVAPAEEMIWSKGFVCERERYDGADVNHLIRAAGNEMDWSRVMRRFDRHWEVLFSHLLMYRFAYPADRTKVPDWVMTELLSRTVDTLRVGDTERNLCRGLCIIVISGHGNSWWVVR